MILREATTNEVGNHYQRPNSTGEITICGDFLRSQSFGGLMRPDVGPGEGGVTKGH